MEYSEYLEKLKKEIITIDNMNRINDCYIRYLFSEKGNERIILSFINSVMKNMHFKTFVKAEILNPFNLSKYLESKESVMDIRCTTDSGEVVIIEIQSQGNIEFIYRSLFYWANGYAVMLNKGDNYNNLCPVISINILNFNLMYDINDIHTCYVLKEIKHNRILTNHCQLHYIELPKFNFNSSYDEAEKKFLSWLKFFKGDKMENLLKEDTIFEEVKLKSESFVHTNPLIDSYRRKEADEYFNKRMLDYELAEAERKGISKGIEKGIEKEKYVLAKNMKNENLDINLISKITGLSTEEILKL